MKNMIDRRRRWMAILVASAADGRDAATTEHILLARQWVPSIVVSFNRDKVDDRLLGQRYAGCFSKCGAADSSTTSQATRFRSSQGRRLKAVEGDQASLGVPSDLKLRQRSTPAIPTLDALIDKPFPDADLSGRVHDQRARDWSVT